MTKKIFTDESLVTFVDEIKSYINSAVSTKANSSHNHNDLYYTIAQIDAMELITVNDIDTICGSSIVAASEVTF